MKFVPVPITGGPTGGQRVLFSVWETRVRDYAVFASETKRKLPKLDFEQGPTHPAVSVSWNEATAFCAWLTERERKVGRIGAGEGYRLPTGHEWSCAVGIGEQEDPATPPMEKDRKLPGLYPWGSLWPPPHGAGNYSGEEASARRAEKQAILTGYHDDFVETAPVGSFTANRFGLFDLGGNAWEWCEDRRKPEDRVRRGGAFNCSATSMSSSHRGGDTPTYRNQSFGFRVVLAVRASGDPGAPVEPK